MSETKRLTVRSITGGERLNKLFCDIFATYACGPAHYVSCVDMGLRDDSDPFQVKDGDVYPPLSARVYACHRSLTPGQRKEQAEYFTCFARKGYQRAAPRGDSL